MWEALTNVFVGFGTALGEEHAVLRRSLEGLQDVAHGSMKQQKDERAQSALRTRRKTTGASLGLVRRVAALVAPH